MSRRFWLLSILCVIGCGETTTPQDGPDSSRPPRSSVRSSEWTKPLPPTTTGTPPPEGWVTDHGGPMMLGPVCYHLIWYGWPSADQATTATTITYLVNNLLGSSYFSILSDFYALAGIPPQIFEGVCDYTVIPQANVQPFPPILAIDNPVVSNLSVPSVIRNLFASSLLVPRSTDIYVFLISDSTTQVYKDTFDSSSEFCTGWCSLHYNFTYQGIDIKYIVVPQPSLTCSTDPAQCGLSAQDLHNPASIQTQVIAFDLTHEINETITDPDLNGWLDNWGYEATDRCVTAAGPPLVSRVTLRAGGPDFVLPQTTAFGGGVLANAECAASVQPPGRAFCGDGVCGSNETHSTCPFDCPPPPPPPPPGCNLPKVTCGCGLGCVTAAICAREGRT
jgi:hypothetical protein